MNAFAKLALLNIVEGMEIQLRSLKNLIGNLDAAGVTAPHKTVPMAPYSNPDELTLEEEERLAKSIAQARTAEIERMRAQGEDFFRKEAENILGGIAQASIPTPPPHPLEPQLG